MKARLFWTLIGVIVFIAILGILGVDGGKPYAEISLIHFGVAAFLWLMFLTLNESIHEGGLLLAVSLPTALHFFAMGFLPGISIVTLLGVVFGGIALLMFVGFWLTESDHDDPARTWPDMESVWDIAMYLADTDPWRTVKVDETPHPKKFSKDVAPWWSLLGMHQFF